METLKLKNYRLSKGLTQAQLAKALGIEEKTYGHYETGYSAIPTNVLLSLSHIYKVTINELLGDRTFVDEILLTGEQMQVLIDSTTELVEIIKNISYQNGIGKDGLELLGEFTKTLKDAQEEIKRHSKKS